jgi:hypothetical protein
MEYLDSRATRRLQHHHARSIAAPFQRKYLRRRMATFGPNSLENCLICAAGILCFCPLSLGERAGGEGKALARIGDR